MEQKQVKNGLTNNELGRKLDNLTDILIRHVNCDMEEFAEMKLVVASMRAAILGMFDNRPPKGGR